MFLEINIIYIVLFYLISIFVLIELHIRTRFNDFDPLKCIQAQF